MNPVQLALRVLRVDPRSRVSAVLTAMGVAVATALITFLATLPHAAEVRSEREQWQSDIAEASQNSSGVAISTSDFIHDKEIVRMDVAGQLPQVEGAPRIPGPGEVLLSPALAKLTHESPPEQLGDRFPGKTVGILDEQHLRYPEQLVAVVGYPQGALDAVAGFPGSSSAVDRANDDFLLGLLAWVGIVLLAVPSLVLVASASRLTAARRERRLAALRLAGGTPGQVVASVAAETAIASVAGTVLGIALGWPLRFVFRNVPWGGGTWLVSDFLPSPGTVAVVGIGIPVLVVLAAVLGLRRVVRAPLGAAMQQSRKRPRAWRLLSLVVVALVFGYGVTQADGSGSLFVLIGAMAGMILSASLVGPWVTAKIGQLFTKVWWRPSALLAGRRLVSDPKSAYRSSSGVVLAVFAATMTLTLLPGFESLAGGGYAYKDTVLYADIPADKVDQTKQRINDQLKSSGTDAVVSESAMVTLYAPGGQAYSALVMDCEDAAVSTRIEVGSCAGPPTVRTLGSLGLPGTGLNVSAYDSTTGAERKIALPPEVRMRPLAGAGPEVSESVLIEPELVPALMDETESTVTVAPTTEADREAARTALTLAAPGTFIETRELMLHEQRTMLADLRRVSVIGVSIAALLAGCSAAITAAASVVDRRRTFGALIAAGTPRRMLARALRTETALPALVATMGAGLGGVAVAFGLLSMFGAQGSFSPWVFTPIVLGVLVGVLAASACGPMLRKVSQEPFADE